MASTDAVDHRRAWQQFFVACFFLFLGGCPTPPPAGEAAPRPPSLGSRGQAPQTFHVYQQAVPVLRAQVEAKLIAVSDWPRLIQADRSALNQQVVRDRLRAMGARAVPLLSPRLKEADATIRLIALEVYADLAEGGSAALEKEDRERLQESLRQFTYYQDRHARLVRRLGARPGARQEQTQSQQIRQRVEDAVARPGGHATNGESSGASQPPLGLTGVEALGLAYAQALSLDAAELARALAQRLDQELDTEEHVQPRWQSRRLPGEVAVVPLEDRSLLLAAGDKRCRLHIYLLRDRSLVELDNYDLGTCAIRNRPATDGTTAYVGISASDHTSGVAAIDLLTGKTLWRATLGNVGMSNPLLIGSSLLVSADSSYHVDSEARHFTHRDSGLYCMDAGTGRIRWFLPLQGVDGDQSPQLLDGGVRIWTEQDRHPRRFYSSVDVDIETGRVLRPSGRLLEEPSSPPHFVVAPFECESQRGDKTSGPGSGTVHCRGGPGGTTPPIEADVFEPLSREFEAPLVVNGLLFIGSSIVDVEAELEARREAAARPQ